MDDLAPSEISETAWLRNAPMRTDGARPATTPDAITIGDLAREFSVTPRALRFYENKGLMTPRRQGASRLYSRADRDRLALIAKGKRLGFTLVEIRDMIAAKTTGLESDALDLTREKCIEQINMLGRQKREIEAAIAELRDIYTSFYIKRVAHEAAGH